MKKLNISIVEKILKNNNYSIYTMSILKSCTNFKKILLYLI